MYSREEILAEKARRDQKQAYEQEYERRNSSMYRVEKTFENDKALRNLMLQSTLGLGDYLSETLSGAGRAVINPVRRLMGMENIPKTDVQFGEGPVYEKAKEYSPYAIAAATGAITGPMTASTLVGSGALAGGLTNPEDPISGILAGGGTAALGQAAGDLGAIGIQKAAPAIKSGQEWLRGKLPAEEILARVEAAKGTATGLGRILDQPQLTQILENYLKYIPFSGYQKGVNKTIGELEERTARNLEGLSGGEIPKNIDVKEQIQRQLQKSVANKIKISDKNYAELDKAARELGVKVNRDNISQASKEMLGKIESNPELSRKVRSKLIEDLKFYSYPDPEIAAYRNPAIINQIKEERVEPTLNQMLSGETPNLAQGQNISPMRQTPEYSNPTNISMTDFLSGQKQKPSYEFGESNITRGLLGEDQFESLFSGKRFESNRYGTLKHALDTDMVQAIDKSNNPELKTLWKDAQDFYKKEIVPTQSPRIKKFVNDPNLTESENIIATFLKYGPKNDKSKLLGQLTTHLDPAGMERLRYAIFSDEIGETSLKHMTSILNKLGPKQKEMLIPDENMRKNMEELATVAKLNPKALDQMYNPETGAWSKILETVKHGVGAFAGFGAGAAPIGAARYATKKLTDEASREAIVKALLDEGLSKKAAMQAIKKLEKPYAKAKATGTALAVTPKEREK